MARLYPVEPEDFAPELQEALGAATMANRGALGLLRVLAQRPDLTMEFLGFRAGLTRATTLSQRLLELVRLRIAFHNQCRSCMAVRSGAAAAEGVDEALVCSLERPQDAPDLSEAERAAIAYADLMATDHLAAGASTFDRLRTHFSEPEIVELGVHIAIFIGFGRLSATWDIVDDLPARYHARDAAVTPWGSEGEAAEGVLAGHR